MWHAGQKLTAVVRVMADASIGAMILASEIKIQQIQKTYDFSTMGVIPGPK